jgi:aldose 1-epimerase
MEMEAKPGHVSITDEGHLSDEAAALIVEALLHQEIAHVPETVLTHVETCRGCKDNIMEVVTFLRNPGSAGELKQKLLKKAKYKQDWLFYRSKIAAGFVVCALLAGAYFFIYKDSSSSSRFPAGPTANQPDQVVQAKTAAPTTDVSANEKKTSAAQGIKDMNEIKANVGKRKNGYSSASRYRIDPNLENMIGSRLRSGLFEVLEPGNDSVIKAPIHFSWKKALVTPHTLKIVNNKNEALYTYPVQGNSFDFNETLASGLYYWKLESQNELLYVGKFFAGEKTTKMSMIKSNFGKTREGQAVDLYTLTNANGMAVKITDYGGIVTSLKVPDKNGRSEDVVLGFDSLDRYLAGHPYFGAVVGRYGNRIARGKFTLNGTGYRLAANNGENHLHGGIKGFDQVIWNAEIVKKENEVGVKLSYLSKDGEEGYPGNLSVVVTYTLTNDNELKIHYEAETDKPTPVNLTHHSYFNLKGAGNGDILEHLLTIDADRFTPVDEGLIPTGELKSVKNTPMDFTVPKAIGERINQVKGGYDHNYVLTGWDGSLKRAAKVVAPTSGRVMEVWTTEPGLQFYSGNFLDGTITGKNSKVYHKHYGFCLETQHFPDSPNKPQFPSTILEPGKKYTHTTIYRFL